MTELDHMVELAKRLTKYSANDHKAEPSNFRETWFRGPVPHFGVCRTCGRKIIRYDIREPWRHVGSC